MANPERVKQSVTMTPEEWQVFFLADGRRSLAEICRLAGNPDELATLQIIHHLVLSKVLMVVTPAPAGPLGTPGTPAAEPESTTRYQDETPPRTPVSVEFAAPARPPVSPDDTSKIVSAKAVQYLRDARSVTVSRLILLKPGTEGSFPLTGDTYAIGRHRNNDIVITDPKVSSFHARLDRAPDGFVLVGLKSRNGCYVNNRRVDKELLKTGDEIRLGTARLAYKVEYTSMLT